MKKRIYLASPHMSGREMDFVQEAFDTNWIAPLGKNVDLFEKEIAQRVDRKYAAALVSGTAAIHLGLKWLGVGQGDLVFCSSLTFSGSCNSVMYEKAIPVFIDSEYESWNISPAALEKAFEWAKKNNKMPKAVITVNLYGQACDYDAVCEICDRHHTPILEDAAESLGAKYKNRPTGSFGKLSALSFNGNKIITTSGGGMLLSNDENAIKKAKFWATQARDNAPHYLHSELGYNYRLSNVSAGIGRGQLTALEERVAQKKAIYDRYKEAFKDIDDIEMMPVPEWSQPNYWLSCMTLKETSKVKPMDIINKLAENNVEARPIWKPMHTQPYYSEYEFFTSKKDGELSIGEDIFNRGLCLPSDTKMTTEELDYVIGLVKELF
ncbi:MAG: DegT/DnrJ/EryC1/StrS family aminotransferase [Christensenellales bacterium]